MAHEDRPPFENDPARDSRDSRSSRESGAVLVAIGPPSGDEIPSSGPRFSGSGCSGVEMTWKYEKPAKRRARPEE